MAATLGDLPGVAVTGTAVGARPEQRGPELSIVSDDGDTVVNIGPKNPDEDEPKGPFEGEFAANLAETLPSDKLSACANQLWTDIQADEQSRKGWLDTRTRGLGLLGLELIEPRGDVGASSAPLEGMSTVTSPLLLSEVLRAQATARGELLPADGPVKVLDESTYGTAGRDELADALEKDLNTYLTRVAKEYYPDSDRMLFYTCFGGVGYKKGFHCPVRRRPVIESVDAADLIVNAGATDLASARRVTHVIKMRASMVKRMVIAKAYRDVPLGQPTQQVSEAKKKEAEIQGVDVTGAQPQDIDHTLYECCTEWDFGEHPDGLPLPYRITFDHDSRAVLAVRRNWREGDELYMARLRYVRYPYIDAVGIYGLGLLHLLGNTERSLTAATREMLDSGMFANFPGFLYSDAVSRQDTNEMRVPPGGGQKIETGGIPIKDVIMEMPYKDVSAGLLGLVEKLYGLGKELAGSAEIPVSEGMQNAPVGTVLALLEQATRVMSAVHKRMHAAQADEFQMLKELLEEDPAAFWEHGERKVYKWDRQKFLEALEAFELAPVADPNMPTQTHRLLKATGVKLLQSQNPQMYDAKAVDSHVLRMIGFSNPDEFFAKQQMPAPPNPAMVSAQVKQQDTLLREKGKERSDNVKLVMARIREASEAADRASAERIAQEKAAVDRRRVGADLAIEAMEHQSAEAMAHEGAPSDVPPRR